MKALDTNILACFCVDDPGDPEAMRQRPLARRIISSEVFCDEHSQFALAGFVA